MLIFNPLKNYKYENIDNTIFSNYLSFDRVFLFSSCDDFLDRQEDEKLTFDKIWETRGNTRSYWLNSMSFYRMMLKILIIHPG